MSAVDIEYTQRKLKFHVEIYVNVSSPNEDTTLIQQFLQSNIERLATEYIASNNTGLMIDQIRSRNKYGTKEQNL